MAKKGISLVAAPDGSVAYQEGYEVIPSPFETLRELFDKYNAHPDGALRSQITKLCDSVPQRGRPETYIGLAELKLLKEVARTFGPK